MALVIEFGIIINTIVLRLFPDGLTPVSIIWMNAADTVIRLILFHLDFLSYKNDTGSVLPVFRLKAPWVSPVRSYTVYHIPCHDVKYFGKFTCRRVPIFLTSTIFSRPISGRFRCRRVPILSCGVSSF